MNGMPVQTLAFLWGKQCPAAVGLLCCSLVARNDVIRSKLPPIWRQSIASARLNMLSRKGKEATVCLPVCLHSFTSFLVLSYSFHIVVLSFPTCRAPLVDAYFLNCCAFLLADSQGVSLSTAPSPAPRLHFVFFALSPSLSPRFVGACQLSLESGKHTQWEKRRTEKLK